MKLQEDASNPSTNSSGAPYNYLIQSYFSNDKNCSSVPDHRSSAPLGRCVSVNGDASSYRYVLHNYGSSVALDYHYYASSPNCTGNSEDCNQYTSGNWGCSSFSEKPLGCSENSYDGGSTNLLLSSTDLPSNDWESDEDMYEEELICLHGNCDYDIYEVSSPEEATQFPNKLIERSQCPRATGVMNIAGTYLYTTAKTGLDDVWVEADVTYTDASYFNESSVYITAKFVDTKRRLKHNVGFHKWNIDSTKQAAYVGAYVNFRAEFPRDFKMNVNNIRVKIVQFRGGEKSTLDCKNYDLPEIIDGFPDVKSAGTVPDCLPACPYPYVIGNSYAMDEVYVDNVYSKKDCIETCKAMDGYNIANMFNHCVAGSDACYCQKGATSYEDFNQTLSQAEGFSGPDPFWTNCYLG